MKNLITLFLVGIVMTGIQAASFYSDEGIDLQAKESRFGYTLLPNKIMIEDGKIGITPIVILGQDGKKVGEIN